MSAQRVSLFLICLFVLSPAWLRSEDPPLDQTEVFERYLSFREGWAFSPSLDWRQLGDRERDELFSRLDAIRIQAFETVSRIELIRMLLATDYLAEQGGDLRLHAAAGFGFIISVELGFGFESNGLSVRPYLSGAVWGLGPELATASKTGPMGGVFAGMGRGASRTHQPRDFPIVRRENGNTWGGAFLVGASHRDSSVPMREETTDFLLLGIGAWEPRKVDPETYEGYLFHLPLSPLRIPVRGTWYWWDVKRSAERIVGKLRDLRPDAAYREFSKLHRNLARFEAELEGRLKDLEAHPSAAKLKENLRLHPLASAENLFRPQTMLDAEKSWISRTLQACARRIALYGRKDFER